ncbi:replication protein A2 [Oratosquilla oratoria]|uniref:replication protein A2 n=1 Tax=Oratosquilla oratoria TaxID=337810 RepID=UPI003F7754BA
MWNTGGDFGGGGGGGGGGYDSGFGGGGFMDSSSQFQSPGGQGEKKARRAQNLVPVTVHSITESVDDALKISDVEVHMVEIVGLVRAVDSSSTKITYLIDDTTGVIEAVQWLDSDDSETENQTNTIMENSYARLIGSVRTQQGKKHLMIFKIQPLTNLNLLTTHILEAMHSKLKLSKISKMESGEIMVNRGEGMKTMDQSGITGSMGGSSNSSSFMGGGLMQGLNPSQRMVYQVIMQCSDEAGIARDQIYSSIGGKLTKNAIEGCIEFLSNEGHIYSTIDEDHFKSTES